MLLCMNYNDFYKCNNILMRPTRQHDIQFHKPTKTFFERNLQKPDIRELRRPFNPKIAPSEFHARNQKLLLEQWILLLYHACSTYSELYTAAVGIHIHETLLHTNFKIWGFLD